jgi:hypothetical protein
MFLCRKANFEEGMLIVMGFQMLLPTEYMSSYFGWMSGMWGELLRN